MQVKMPQLGETVIEGTILKWLKQEGEHVAQDEPLFEISTDKVDTEVPSPAEGTLTKILVTEGQTVSVGTDLATIDSGDGAAGDAEPAADAEAPAAATPATESAPVETPQVEPAAAVPSAQAPAAAPTTSSTAAPPQAAPPSDRGPRSQILSPLVRKLAAEHGVDLAQVPGTGTGGRITKNDVLSFASSQGAPAGAPAAAAAPAPMPKA
ncbi:MAG: biotin/lipoyl-containing protein, partial [Actinomycetota bacterium]